MSPEQSSGEVSLEDAQVGKYPSLGPSFMKGSLPGQITSAYAARKDNPEKTREFVEALLAGDISMQDVTLTTVARQRLVEMGFPEDRLPSPPTHGPAAPLSPTFFRGRLPGQIDSVWGRREKPEVVQAFKAAIEDGRVRLDYAQLTEGLLKKLVELGVPVSQDLADAVKAKRGAGKGDQS